MKIALVRNYIAPAKDSMGAERVVEALAKGLIELDHDVVMKLNPASTNTPAPLVTEIPKDCDIIHFHSGWDAGVGEIEYDSYGIPWVMTMHGGGIESDPKWLSSATGNPHIICVSKFISDRLKCPSYVWTCSDPDDFVFEKEKDDYFLWMAGTDWEEKKGLWTTISIAKKLGIKLKIAGTGKNQQVIDQIKSQCTDKIEYVGAVNGEEKKKILSKTRALILYTKLPDACPTTVGEAYLSGTPVLSSKFGAMPEIVFHGTTGMIAKNENELARNIILMKTDNYKLFPEGCLAIGKSMFSHTVCAKKYLRLYNNMIKYGNVHIGE